MHSWIMSLIIFHQLIDKFNYWDVILFAEKYSVIIIISYDDDGGGGGDNDEDETAMVTMVMITMKMILPSEQ